MMLSVRFTRSAYYFIINYIINFIPIFIYRSPSPPWLCPSFYYQLQEPIKQMGSTPIKINNQLLCPMIENKGIKIPNREYPLEDVQYDLLPEEKKALVKKLCYLFIFYASKGSKHNYHELQEHYFMELISEVWEAKGKQLHKNKGYWKEIQILYHAKGIKNSLSFKNFLDLLPTIAVYSEPDMSREDSLKSLMHHLINVYETKALGEIAGKLINLDIMFQEDTRQFLSKLSGDLTRLYKLYFPHQVNHKVKTKKFKLQSMECFMEFLKDFEVFPKVISARDIFYIFNEGCESRPSELLYETEESKSVINELGEVFKLSKFVESLVIVSKRAFPKLKQIENEQEWEEQQKYVLRTLLQYMETVKTTNKKKTKYMNERFCFIVLEEHPQQQLIKTIQVKDKLIKEPINNMNFFSLMDKMQL